MDPFVENNLHFVFDQITHDKVLGTNYQLGELGTRKLSAEGPAEVILDSSYNGTRNVNKEDSTWQTNLPTMKFLVCRETAAKKRYVWLVMIILMGLFKIRDTFLMLGRANFGPCLSI